MMNYLQKKKLAFMSIVNRVKGFIRTITGALPLTLEGCVDEESIIDYTIYGNSVQDGTPTPETPVEVESVGEYDETTGKYKIPVKVSGKNLLNPSKFTGGSLVEYNGVQCYKYLDGGSGNFTYTDNFKESTQYVFTIKIYSADNTKNTAIKFIYTDGTSNVLVIKDNVFYMPVTAAGKTLQSIKGEWYYGVTRYIDLSVSQIEEGTTATDYEPYHEPITTNIYLDEPLRKVGEYADYVDFENGKVVRNVCYERMTSVISKSSVVRQAAVYLSNIKKKPLQRPNPNSEGYDPMGYVLSNKFIKHDRFYSKLSTEPYYIQTYITMGGVNRIAYSLPLEVSTVAQAQEVIGDGFDVFYVLEEAEEQPITLPNIPTFKGASIISADTTIQPSNAEITYYSNVKER